MDAVDSREGLIRIDRFGYVFCRLGDRLRVGRQILDLIVRVRILLPQPISAEITISTFMTRGRALYRIEKASLGLDTSEHFS